MRFPTAPLRRPQALWFSPRLWRRRVTFWLGALAVGVGFAKLGSEEQRNRHKLSPTFVRSDSYLVI